MRVSLMNDTGMEALNMKKAMIYARQSVGDDVESASVENQIDTCLRIAEKEGYTIIGIETDLNTSGRTYPNTPSAMMFANNDAIYKQYVSSFADGKKFRNGLGRVFDNLKNFDVLFVYDETRLMRPLADSFLEAYVRQTLIENKIKIHTKEKLFDFADFSANLVNSLENRINSNQIIICKQKAKEALKKLQDEGYLYKCPNCYGFAFDGKQKVKIVDAEIENVKIIFNMLEKGIQLKKIINHLTEIDRSGKKRWYLRDIYRIANRLEYTGLTKNSKGEIVKSQVYPQIISFSLYQEVQKRFKKTTHSRDKECTHPLSGLIKCGYCGHSMHIGKGSLLGKAREHETPYYFSCSFMYSVGEIRKDCYTSTIREKYHAPIDNKNGINQAILPLLIASIRDEINRKRNISIDKDKILIDVEKIERLEKILDKKLIDGTINEAEYTDRFSIYAKRKKDLKNQLIKFETVNTEEQEFFIKNLLKNIGKRVFITDEKFKMLANEFIKEIVVFDEKVIVRMNDGKEYTLPRLHDRSARFLPIYEIEVDGEKMFVQYKGKKGEDLLRVEI